jgi:hypothetical protein
MNTPDNNTTQSFAQSITEKIRSEGITPRSKWVSIAIQILLWIPWFFVTTIGIVGVTGIIFTIGLSEWGHFSIVRYSPILYVLQTISVVWIICLVLFSILVIKAFRITRKGYRVSPFTIVTLSLAVSIAGGSLIYIGDRIIAENAYFRRPIQAKQQQLWDQPYKGRISGVLGRDGDAYMLSNISGYRWTLDMTDFIGMEILEGSAVRAIGIPLNENVFKVCRLLPLRVSTREHRKPSLQRIEISEDIKLQTYERAKNFSCERNVPARP